MDAWLSKLLWEWPRIDLCSKGTTLRPGDAQSGMGVGCKSPDTVQVRAGFVPNANSVRPLLQFILSAFLLSRELKGSISRRSRSSLVQSSSRISPGEAV